MRRRSLLPLATLGLLAACGPKTARADPGASPSPGGDGRTATAADYRWFEDYDDLSKGFCFTWIHHATPAQVLTGLKTRELERVTWQQLVGSGDGQQLGADRHFFGVARVDQWSLMIEDNGMLGTTDNLIDPLSRNTTVVSHYRSSNGHGRLLILEDQQTRLDFDPLDPAHRTGRSADTLLPLIDAAGFGTANQIRLTADPARYRNYCMESAFALTERVTTIPMTLDLLQSKTYILASIPSD